jgi:protocatechuate 3,4-dioxygenase beta subunit
MGETRETKGMHGRGLTSLIALTSFLIITITGVVSTKADECMPSQQDVMGPYYLAGAPFRTDIAGPEERGERIVIKGTVSDCTTSIPNALIEVWQTDAGGAYHDHSEGYRMRGQMKAGSRGNYEFRSVKPGRYGLRGQFRPAHIHIRVSHPGYETLVTQLYFRGDPYLWPNDSCGTYCKSNDPNRIIELKREKAGLYTGQFDIVLKPLNK